MAYKTGIWISNKEIAPALANSAFYTEYVVNSTIENNVSLPMAFRNRGHVSIAHCKKGRKGRRDEDLERQQTGILLLKIGPLK